MGLGDFCTRVQGTQDGGGVYAKSRDKRDPPAHKYKKYFLSKYKYKYNPPVQKYKNTLFQITNDK